MKPIEIPDWQDALRRSVVTFGFNLHLSKSMLSYLCAVADDVTWDRMIESHISAPCNFITTEAALTKKGLIRRKPRIISSNEQPQSTTWTNLCELTPAGDYVVQLVKLAGLFDEQIVARARRGRG